MSFVSVRELRGRPREVWKRLAREREIVVTSNGRPIGILSAVTPQDLEESLAAIRRARGIAAVDALQRASVKRGTDRMTLGQINRVIRAVRRARRR